MKITIEKSLLTPYEAAVLFGSLSAVYEAIEGGRLNYLLDPTTGSILIPDVSIEDFLAQAVVASAVAAVEATEATTG
jgi:hypothetical protein